MHTLTIRAQSIEFRSNFEILKFYRLRFEVEKQFDRNWTTLRLLSEERNENKALCSFQIRHQFKIEKAILNIYL